MSLSLGKCSLLVPGGMSGLTLDSAGGNLFCGSDGSYSDATVNYPSGCGAWSGAMVAQYWQSGGVVQFPVSGVRQCSSSSAGTVSVDSQLNVALQQLAKSGSVWGALSVGILFSVALGSIAFGIRAIVKLINDSTRCER